MNEIVNKFLLAQHKSIPEKYLRQHGFTCIACGSFTRNKEIIQKFKETGDLRYIHQNALDKAWFQPDITYEDFKDWEEQLLIKYYWSSI